MRDGALAAQREASAVESGARSQVPAALDTPEPKRRADKAAGAPPGRLLVAPWVVMADTTWTRLQSLEPTGPLPRVDRAVVRRWEVEQPREAAEKERREGRQVQRLEERPPEVPEETPEERWGPVAAQAREESPPCRLA